MCTIIRTCTCAWNSTIILTELLPKKQVFVHIHAQVNQSFAGKCRLQMYNTCTWTYHLVPTRLQMFCHGDACTHVRTSNTWADYQLVNNYNNIDLATTAVCN